MGKHELAYDVVRDGLSDVPVLGNQSPYDFAHDWMEMIIEEGEPAWDVLRRMGTR